MLNRPCKTLKFPNRPLSMAILVLLWACLSGSVFSSPLYINYGVLTGSRFPAASTAFRIFHDPTADWKNQFNEHRRKILQEALLSAAMRFHQRPDIPYIWGGGAIADAKVCLACRNCVKRKKVGLYSRLKSCKPCQKCGLDCSHFVNMIYRNIGLDYPYSSTAIMNELNSSRLSKLYKLVSLGKNLDAAQPGDLLLYPRHVVMLLRRTGKNRGDIIHATDMGDELGLGGIRIEKNYDLRRIGRKLRKILRHRQFFQNPFHQGSHTDSSPRQPSGSTS